MKELHGAGVALITPFNEEGNVDVFALKGMVAHCIKGGIDYLVVLGTTAESVTLSKEEKQLVVQTVVTENKGRLPLVIGIGGNNTRAVVEELQTMNLSAFCAVLSVSPYYNKPTQEGIYQHFKAISKASPLPIIVYNVPGRTGSNMLPHTVVRLAGEFENIVAIKEASGDLNQISELIATRPEGFLVLSGDDITAVASILAGGEGVISVIGQGIPSEFTTMIHAAQEGNSLKANELHNRLTPGMKLIFEEGNPAGIKILCSCLGITKPYVRLPLIEASKSLELKIAAFLEAVLKVSV